MASDAVHRAGSPSPSASMVHVADQLFAVATTLYWPHSRMSGWKPSLAQQGGAVSHGLASVGSAAGCWGQPR